MHRYAGIIVSLLVLSSVCLYAVEKSSAQQEKMPSESVEHRIERQRKKPAAGPRGYYISLIQESFTGRSG